MLSPAFFSSQRIVIRALSYSVGVQATHDPFYRLSCCFSPLLLCCDRSVSSSGRSGRMPPSAPASTQPAVTTTQSPEITQFQKIEDNWADAINRHDQYSLENVLSPLFVDVAASGDITTRNQQLAQVIAGEDKTMWLTQKVITVRMLGDIAVANGTYTLHHKVNTAAGGRKRRLHARLRASSRRLGLRQLAADSAACGLGGRKTEEAVHS